MPSALKIISHRTEPISIRTSVYVSTVYILREERVAVYLNKCYLNYILLLMYQASTNSKAINYDVVITAMLQFTENDIKNTKKTLYKLKYLPRFSLVKQYGKIDA